jgi:hypothetical protein
VTAADARDDAFIAAIDEVRAERDEAIAERDRYREALAMIGSKAPWVKLSDVREYARAVLANDLAARLTEGQST